MGFCAQKAHILTFTKDKDGHSRLSLKYPERNDSSLWQEK